MRLRSETLLIDQSEGFGEDFREVESAVIDLRFNYSGLEVEADEPFSLEQCFRDARGESEVRRVVESFGAVELSEVEDIALLPGATATYAVNLEGDPDALAAFSTQAVPRMREMGWEVEVDANYPCHVVEDARWYASVNHDAGPSDDIIDEGEERGWFELELGVEVEGEQVDLLPVLLDLIEARGMQALLQTPRRRQMALPLGGKRYLAVPPGRIKTVVRVLSELYEIEGTGPGGGLKVPELASDVLDELQTAFEDDSLNWSGDTERVRMRVPRDEPPPVDPPAGLKATLRPYQMEGLAFLQHLRAHGAGAILADDMGLGKTLQTITHILKEKESGRMHDPVLVVAPTSLVGNWQREIAKFAPALEVHVHYGSRRRHVVRNVKFSDVVITTYGLLMRDSDVFESQAFYMVVLDEAQTIKNARSQAHAAVKAVDAQYRIALSGTPVENNLDELWALFDFAMPGLLGDAPQFRAAFRVPIEKQGNTDRMDTLRRRVAPFILRRLKTDVATDLPPKTIMTRPVELSGEQRDLYESIRIAGHALVRKVVKKKGIAASTIDILGALMKLRQVCCDPRLVRMRTAQAIEQSAKFEALFEMLPDMLEQGRQVLIFSQFTRMLALIGDELRERGIEFVVITGSTTDRQAAVDAFQSGTVKVFLLSLKAAGTGLNLVAADTVIHFDPWWNPAAQAQATDRAYRIGQKRPVFVYNLIVSGSVEERMVALQRHKQALADGLLAQDEDGIELTAEDVDDLFAPLSG
ncbi:MAG: DEAD/DEAH box helicase [Nannocystaceae bacterium]|nr:DEAD/DEAH box helicase [bacterium]